MATWLSLVEEYQKGDQRKKATRRRSLRRFWTRPILMARRWTRCLQPSSNAGRATSGQACDLSYFIKRRRGISPLFTAEESPSRNTQAARMGRTEESKEGGGRYAPDNCITELTG